MRTATSLLLLLLLIGCNESPPAESSGTPPESPAESPADCAGLGSGDAVQIDWVTVGDPENAADTEVMSTDGTTGYGSVPYVYRISKYETTNAQYAEFLNSIASIDPYELYPGMSSKISRSGFPGTFRYNPELGQADLPVVIISFWSAIRFANWLHNGQPVGGQCDSTTENGAYTITTEGVETRSITRNSSATVFVPNEDEWYKAAYYKGGGLSAGYWDYPAGSDTQTSCTAPGATPNTASCDRVWGVISVGSYSGSASPSGTFDQGGNVSEWTETIIIDPKYGSKRGLRGGSYFSDPPNLGASARWSISPHSTPSSIGFRVASIP